MRRMGKKIMCYSCVIACEIGKIGYHPTLKGLLCLIWCTGKKVVGYVMTHSDACTGMEMGTELSGDETRIGFLSKLPYAFMQKHKSDINIAGRPINFYVNM